MILSALLFLLLSGLWLSLFSSVRSNAQATTSLEEKVLADKDQGAVLFSDATLAKNFASSTESLMSFFPSSDNVASLIELIEKTATSSSVTVSISSISVNTDTSSPVSALSFSLSASGTWGNLLAFAATLENMQYDVALKKISFFRNSNDAKGVWHFQTDVDSFVSN